MGPRFISRCVCCFNQAGQFIIQVQHGILSIFRGNQASQPCIQVQHNISIETQLGTVCCESVCWTTCANPASAQSTSGVRWHCTAGMVSTARHGQAASDSWQHCRDILTNAVPNDFTILQCSAANQHIMGCCCRMQHRAWP